MVDNLSETKTARILDYLVSRSNEKIPVERMASDLKIEKKTVASIASRLVARGIITRASRGVYVHRVESVKASTVRNIFKKYEATMERTFGRQILERTGISEFTNRKSVEDLERALQRSRKIIGHRAADNIIRLVTRNVAKSSESRYILARLGV